MELRDRGACVGYYQQEAADHTPQHPQHQCCAFPGEIILEGLMVAMVMGTRGLK